MLSAFDGVGAAPWLVWDLIGEPRAIFAWEVDRAAIQVADYHIPGIRHRGDITEDTPEDLAAEIQHIDGQAECIIIFTAAPPCQDFSRVGDRDGHAGSRGYLFNFTAEFIDELRRRLAPCRFGFLVENVEMTPADAAEASKQLGCQPTFADAADFGWIGRPRLWWSSVDWDEITHDPSTAERWTWVLHRRWDRLRLDSPRAAPDSFDLDGLKFFRCGGLWSHQVAVLYYAGGRRERETTAAIHARQGHDGGPAEVAPGQPPVCAVALSTRRHAHRRPGEAGGFDAEREGTAPPHAEELHGGDGAGRPGAQNPPSPLGQWLALGSRTPIPVGGLGSCGRVAPNDGGDTNNTADLNHPVGRRTVGASRPTHGPGAGEAHA